MATSVLENLPPQGPQRRLELLPLHLLASYTYRGTVQPVATDRPGPHDPSGSRPCTWSGCPGASASGTIAGLTCARSAAHRALRRRHDRGRHGAGAGLGGCGARRGATCRGGRGPGASERVGGALPPRRRDRARRDGSTSSPTPSGACPRTSSSTRSRAPAGPPCCSRTAGPTSRASTCRTIRRSSTRGSRRPPTTASTPRPGRDAPPTRPTRSPGSR